MWGSPAATIQLQPHRSFPPTFIPCLRISTWPAIAPSTTKAVHFGLLYFRGRGAMTSTHASHITTSPSTPVNVDLDALKWFACPLPLFLAHGCPFSCTDVLLFGASRLLPSHSLSHCFTGYVGVSITTTSHHIALDTGQRGFRGTKMVCLSVAPRLGTRLSMEVLLFGASRPLPSQSLQHCFRGW